MTTGRPTLGGYQVWTDLWVRCGWRVQQSTLDNSVRLLTPGRRIAATGSLEQCLAVGREMAPRDGNARAAILLHGLGRGRHVMRRLELALGQSGWAVANVGYPSLRRPVEHHAAAVRSVALGLQDGGAQSIALVGHSLGGLIARAAAAHAADDGWPLGRVVLIGSPARGSAIAEVLKAFAPFRLIAGHGGMAVTRLRAAKIPVPTAEIAVIAGGNGGKGYNPLLGGDNDGVVTVDETRLPGAEADFLMLPSIHTTLPTRRDVVAAALHFLETGRLRAASSTASPTHP